MKEKYEDMLCDIVVLETADVMLEHTMMYYQMVHQHNN